MAYHEVSRSKTGRFTALFSDTAENITIRDSKATLWKYVLEEGGTIDDLWEIIDGRTDLAASELVWLIETMRQIDTWITVCPYDLRTYGQVGVSF